MSVRPLCSALLVAAVVLTFAGEASGQTKPIETAPEPAAAQTAEPVSAGDAAQGQPPAREPAVIEVRAQGGTTARELRESPYAVTVVETKRYAGRATDLNELLNRASGVKIRASGGAGSDVRISLRGLEGRRVALFIDGMPVISQDGGFGLSSVPLPLVERVEVYKGIVPAELGGDGLGAAINVVTRERQESYNDFSYGVGSFNTHHVVGLAKYWDPEHRYAVDAGVIGDYAENDYDMPGPEGVGRIRRNHDEYGQLLGHVGVDLKRLWFDTVRLDLGAGHSFKELQGLPGAAFGVRLDVREARFDSTSYYARLTLAKADVLRGADLNYTLYAPYQRLRFRDTATVLHDFDGTTRANPNGRGEYGFGPNSSDDERVTLRQRLNLRYALTDDHTLNFNSIANLGWSRPEDPVADAAAGFRITPLPAEAQSVANGLSYQGKLLNDRLTAVLGVKQFFLHAEGSATSIYQVITNAEIERVSQEQHAFGANVAARYRLFGPLMAKVGYERAVRLPGESELFGNGFSLQGSINLKPETSDNVDAGLYFEGRSGKQKVQAELSGFVSWVDDLITLIGGMVPAYANTDSARVLGAEVDVRADVTGFLHVYANGTFQDVRDTTAFYPGTTQPNFRNGLRIPNVPYLFGNYGLEVHGPTPFAGAGGRTRLFYDASFVGEYFYDYELSKNQRSRIPEQLVHTLGLQQTFAAGRYSLNFEVVNLGDAQRFDQFNQPLPGRTFRALFRTTLLQD